MQAEVLPLADVTKVIQAAIAPVFLITGVSGMLSVLTNRLGRVIDRARTLEAELPHMPIDRQAATHDRLLTLSRRAKLIYWATTLCTTCALLVCAVIAVLFVGSKLGLHVATTVAVLFVSAMVSFFCGLLCFLREIFIATVSLRIGLR